MSTRSIFTLIIVTAIFCVICPAQAVEPITVTAEGDGSYYFDEVIRLSGTNTESDNVYLFITGPNLNKNGEKPGEFDRAAITGDEETFVKTSTNADGTWDYELDSNELDLSQGSYTIYAVTGPYNKADLSSGKFDTATLILKKRQNATKTESDTEAVKSGNITITSSGDGSYYNGEEITFSGTDTESDCVYLFITGDILKANGEKPDDPGTAAVTGSEDTFARADVDSDNSWEYKLDTSDLDLDPGPYSVYAVTGPNNKKDLPAGEYDTVSIVIKRPFISVKVSEPVIKRGEELVITGNAEGGPKAVAIWVLGFSYWNGAKNGSMVAVVPEDDSSYEYVLKGDETMKMDDGEYYVIAQHPMYNDEFDVTTGSGDGDGILVSTETGPGFYIWGADNRLRGADASEALIEEIDSADVDDTYAKCTFKVEGQVEGTYKNDESGNEEEQPDTGSDNSIFSAIGEFFAGIFGSN